jgi:hypothetical protein
MSDPKNMDEYNKRFKLGELVDGHGFDTAMSVPCPFCATPGWAKYKILEMQQTMSQSKTCKNCNRSAKMIFDRTRSSIEAELVQTGGPDQPEWLEPKIRRVG